MGKISFSHKIEESFNECFEKLYQELGPPKYRILEACIEAFAYLPRDIQYRLRGLNAKDRDYCLDLIAHLESTTKHEEPMEVQNNNTPITLRQALRNMVEKIKAEQPFDGTIIEIHPSEKKMWGELSGNTTLFSKQIKKRKKG